MLAAALASAPHEAAAQNLFFSSDGREVRRIKMFPPATEGEQGHTFAITYDAATGEQIRSLDLGSDTWFFSATTDGRIVIVSKDRDRNDVPARLLRVDLKTGRSQPLPSSWFDDDDHNPYAQISGDGRLVSGYSEEGPEESPRIVTVYRWRGKKIVAEQSTGHSAGGFDGGGVTPDGKIEFTNNRSGSQVVDPKTGQVLVSYGPTSVRSADGAWIVDFPNPSYGGDRNYVPILNGMNGEPVGKLDITLTDDEIVPWWRGAFCGASRRFVASGPGQVIVFEIPSGKRIATFRVETWADPATVNLSERDRPIPSVACSSSGKRIAIDDGTRFTLHNVK